MGKSERERTKKNIYYTIYYYQEEEQINHTLHTYIPIPIHEEEGLSWNIYIYIYISLYIYLLIGTNILYSNIIKKEKNKQTKNTLLFYLAGPRCPRSILFRRNNYLAYIYYSAQKRRQERNMT